MVALLSALSARLVQIQLVERQRYAASSSKAFHRVERLPAIRGMTVDRNGEPIAKSIPVASVYVDKNHLNDPKLASFGLAYMEAAEDASWRKLSAEERVRRIYSLRGEILARESADVIVQKHLARVISLLDPHLKMDRNEIRAAIETNKAKWFPIAKDIPDDTAERLREIVDENYLQGIAFENSIQRWYANPNLATHLSGFTGEVKEITENGKTAYRMAGRFGVESSQEEFLAGRDGRREHRRDSRGMIVPGKASSLLPPRAGLNVKLTIDLGTQAIVEEELDAGLDQFK